MPADGKEHPTDMLICATGFDTSFRPCFPPIGREGRDLAQEWELEPRSYLGLAASGFPNYFMYLGPNCPIANGPIIFSIIGCGRLHALEGRVYGSYNLYWRLSLLVQELT